MYYRFISNLLKIIFTACTRTMQHSLLIIILPNTIVKMYIKFV